MPSNIRLFAPVVLLALATATSSAQQRKDAFDVPLPEGAKARLGTAAMTLRAGTGQITILPPDYKTFLVPGINGQFLRFELATGKPLDAGKLQFGFGGVVTSGDGKRAVAPAASRGKKLVVRDTKTGNPIGELELPEGFHAQGGVSLSQDGKVVARGAETKDRKGAAVVWKADKNEGVVLETLHAPPVLLSLAPDGTGLVTHGYQFPAGVPPKAGSDPNAGRTFQVWDLTTGMARFRGTVTGAYQIAAAVFSPDGGTLATSAGDGPVDLWDVKTGKRTRTLLGRAGMGTRLAFSPEGKTVAALATDGAIRRWTVADGKLLGTTEAPDDLPLALPGGLAFADNERVIAWGVVNVTVAVAWEAPARKVLTPFSGQTTAIQSIAFGTGGKEVVTAGLGGGQVFRWDAATGKRLGRVALRPNRWAVGYPQPPLRLSPDATRGLSTLTPHAVYDLATGEQLFVIPVGSGAAAAAAALPTTDFTKVVTFFAHTDPRRPATVAVWDLTKQEKVTEVELNAAGSLSAVAVSPSGNRLLFACSSRVAVGKQQSATITALDLKTGKQLSQVEVAEPSGVRHLAAADEKSAVVSSGDRIWVLDYERGAAAQEIDSFKGRTDNRPLPLAFSRDGKLLAAGVPGEERPTWGVRVYEWPSGKVRHTFTGHTAPVSVPAFSPDGKTLASGSHDTTVLLWDLTTLPAPK